METKSGLLFNFSIKIRPNLTFSAKIQQQCYKRGQCTCTTTVSVKIGHHVIQFTNQVVLIRPSSKILLSLLQHYMPGQARPARPSSDPPQTGLQSIYSCSSKPWQQGICTPNLSIKSSLSWLLEKPGRIVRNKSLSSSCVKCI